MRHCRGSLFRIGLSLKHVFANPFRHKLPRQLNAVPAFLKERGTKLPKYWHPSCNFASVSTDFLICIGKLVERSLGRDGYDPTIMSKSQLRVYWTQFSIRAH